MKKVFSFYVLLVLLNLSCVTSENQHSESFPLEEKTIIELQQLMSDGTYSAVELCQLYIDRIKAVDQGEDGLHSVLELNPDALTIAAALDLERKAGQLRGPLHGIPVMIKDNINTGDQMETSAGSLALLGSEVQEDAYIVAKLREAGAVLLGKTNLSEWANFRSERSSSGWSGRGRQTRNPYAMDRSPCGSSSGSGVAASANLCALAIGTETNGSIVCPSSLNGVVGIKPTVGLWSRTGIIPISKTQDTAGPMARTVADAATLLGALVGVDSNDVATQDTAAVVYQDYTQFLDVKGLQGKRIGIFRGPMGQHEGVDAVMEQSFLAMKAAGAILIDSIALGEMHYLGNAEYELLLYEFKDGLNAYLGGLKPDFPYKNLEDLIVYNRVNKDQEMPYFQQEIFELAQTKGDLNDETYQEALALCQKISRVEGIDLAISTHQLDAIVAPSGDPAWVIDQVNGDNYRISSSSMPAMAGYPSITVPAGEVHGLPIGISFFSTAYKEADLIAIAYAFEQQTKARIVPQLLATLPLP
ncbi:amidase [Reichenbachiella carrageenanivorans]|uniref:Amidase n=1 Tax=Reichenbachiella carrageenanivorans TaxID=2979869 RepID=A0ABY6D0R2_9BACT|nr:amidase [Reichenbachiella carrageenanivorans]UXX79215.1 amidase [Reichenbachiella carrageenanivorans]